MARSQTARDNAWNLISRLEDCDRVTATRKGVVASGVWFSVDGMGVDSEILEVLAKYDKYLTKAVDSHPHDWLVIDE